MKYRILLTTTLALTTAGLAAPSHAADRTPTCDPTGRTDVSACLNQFFAGLSDGTTVTLAPGATYRAEQTVTLADKTGIRLDGRGATLFATTIGTTGRAHLALVGDTDVAVRDLVIKGANAKAGPAGPYREDLEAQHGVKIRGSQQVLLDGLSISQTWGDAVYLGRLQAYSDSRDTTDVTIRNTTINGTGRQGIGISTADRVLIEHNNLFGARRSTIDLEPNVADHGISDVTIRDNVVKPGRFNFVAAAYHGPVDNVLITGNHGVGKSLRVIAVGGKHSRANWRIEDNVSDTPVSTKQDGVVIADHASGLIYQNNVQPVVAGRGIVGVLVRNGSCGVISQGNTLGKAPQTNVARRDCAGAQRSGTPAVPQMG